MLPSRSAIRARLPRITGALLVALAAAFALLTFVSAPASASTGAEGDPYTVSGNVQLDGEPLEGVHLTIDGPGGLQEVDTDENGQWSVKVPEKNTTYVVTLDESTLPTGIAVVDETDDSPNVKEAEMGPGGFVTMNFFIGEGERNITSFFDQFVQRTVDGLNFGLMLALAAVGLSLVFGTTGISNFAHSEMVTFGAIAASALAGGSVAAVTGLITSLSLDLPPLATTAIGMVVAVIVAVLLSALLGLLLDVVLWRPLRRKRVGTVQLMIVSIGLSLAMRYIFQFFIGGGTTQLPLSELTDIPLFGAVALSPIDMISIVISILVIVGFALWLTYSRLGKATRAISDNPSLAAASGIDVDAVVRVVWTLAGAMAGLAGILYAYYRPGIKWDMGAQILLLIFAAVTLGGLGTAFGALIGSIIIGLITELSSLWIPADLRFAGALIVLIVIMLFRPQGILGRRERIG